MYKILCLSLFMMLFAGTQASDSVGEIEVHLQKVISEQVKKECSTCQVELIIHNKTILSDIAVPDKVIADRWRGQTNLLLQLGDGNRLVTVTIRWKDQVVIAKKNIRQGHIMEKNDLTTVEKDVTFLQAAYINNPQDAIGMEVRKLYRRGQVLEESYIKKPLVVKFGQTIEVQLQEGALRLAMMGQARGAGAVGDTIPVFLTNTKKKISAVIVDKETVRVQ